jgi:hypothetical protein
LSRGEVYRRFDKEPVAAMPQPDLTVPRATCSPGDPSQGLIECLATYLAPLFVTDTDDLPAARLMAIRAMISYRPGMKADFIAVARSIALSMSALAALSRAATEDMPAALRLRYFGVANALGRSAEQGERTMERRCRQGADVARRGAGAAGDEIPEAPGDDFGACEPGPDDRGILGLGEEELAAGEAAVAEAMLEFTSRRVTAAPPAGADAGSDTTAGSRTASDGGGVGGAKTELAAMISASQRLGAIRQLERGFERNLGGQQELGQAPGGGARVRLPYRHETAAVRPEVPI